MTTNKTFNCSVQPGVGTRFSVSWFEQIVLTLAGGSNKRNLLMDIYIRGDKMIRTVILYSAHESKNLRLYIVHLLLYLYAIREWRCATSDTLQRERERERERERVQTQFAPNAKHNGHQGVIELALLGVAALVRNEKERYRIQMAIEKERERERATEAAYEELGHR